MAKKTLLFKALSYKYEHTIIPKHLKHAKNDFYNKNEKNRYNKKCKNFQNRTFSFVYLFVCLFNWINNPKMYAKCVDKVQINNFNKEKVRSFTKTYIILWRHAFKVLTSPRLVRIWNWWSSYTFSLFSFETTNTWLGHFAFVWSYKYIFFKNAFFLGCVYKNVLPQQCQIT